jgi:hypothetical protein
MAVQSDSCLLLLNVLDPTRRSLMQSSWATSEQQTSCCATPASCADNMYLLPAPVLAPAGVTLPPHASAT